MNLEFTGRTDTDLAGIHACIAERNPAAADRVIARIVRSIDALDFPMIGRVGRLPGTREWLVAGSTYTSAH